MTTREENLRKLHKLRRNGWERDTLQYGLPFREDKATDTQLQFHVWKVENHRATILRNRWVLLLKVIGLIILLAIIIGGKIM